MRRVGKACNAGCTDRSRNDCRTKGQRFKQLVLNTGSYFLRMYEYFRTAIVWLDICDICMQLSARRVGDQLFQGVVRIAAGDDEPCRRRHLPYERENIFNESLSHQPVMIDRKLASKYDRIVTLAVMIAVE